jgi:gamma-glutamyltranspeptidase/glutathione hydrolase
VAKLTSKAYAKTLAAKINQTSTSKTNSYGMTKAPPNDSGTSHVSIVDASGNMIACTSTVNTSFGSMVLVPEYDLVLNNEMDDFSAQPNVPNAYGLVGNAQNAIAPKKRPLSSMSPTLVLKTGQPWMAIGASGGPTIITGTLGVMLQMMDFASSAKRAVTGPRLHHQWLPPRVYMEPGQPKVESRLTEAKHKIKIGPAFNSVQIVVRRPQGWVGVSDPRKHGFPAAAP